MTTSTSITPGHMRPSQQAITVAQGGTNRAAAALRDVYRQTQQREGLPVGVLGVDRRGRRAADWAASLLGTGVAAQGMNGLIEDYVASPSAHPLVLTVDTTTALANTVQALRRQGAPRAVAAYFIARASKGQVFGVAAGIEQGDEAALGTYHTLVDRFGRNVIPTGYESVFGGRYAAEAFSAERLIRMAFSSHLADILPKAAAGLPFDRPAMEIVWNGRLLPLTYHDRSFGWADPPKLAELSLREHGRAMRGNAFAMAESGPEDALRFHHVHLRSDRDETEFLGRMDLEGGPEISALAQASHRAPMAVTD